ncbi:MAG TPA: XdhC family protein, partial [Anaerolineales bacterium]|nr:XdhC family protein [Anaerolineales bacterium]
MREIISEIETWRAEGKPIALATAVKRDGVSMRPLGAKMAVSTSLEIAGSVTGGCIEGAVYEEAQTVIHSRVPKLLSYGVPDEDRPWEIGLSCGSRLEVFIEPLQSPQWDGLYPAIKHSLDENQLVAVATLIEGNGLGNKMVVWSNGKTLGSLGNSVLDADAAKWSHQQMGRNESNWKRFEEASVFVDVLPPPARLIVIGAVHIAIPLVTLAKTLGFHVTVIDPREAFATRQRFPHADELVTEWLPEALEKLRPDENTYIAALSHDEKLDNPALKTALASPARYVGVLGSRKNIGKRRVRPSVEEFHEL